MLRSGFSPENALNDGPAFWIFFQDSRIRVLLESHFCIDKITQFILLNSNPDCLLFSAGWRARNDTRTFNSGAIFQYKTNYKIFATIPDVAILIFSVTASTRLIPSSFLRLKSALVT